MTFVPRFTLHGGPFPVRAYGIAASEEWDVYDVLALNGAGALTEPTAANKDVIGVALGNVGNTTTGQSDADELRAYLYGKTAPGHEPVQIFLQTVVYETDDENNTGAAAAADIGERADLELQTGEWGINNGTSGTSNTPQFTIIDVEPVNSTYLVVPDPVSVSGVFQIYDAAV